jgi:hypothetical protein
MPGNEAPSRATTQNYFPLRRTFVTKLAKIAKASDRQVLLAHGMPDHTSVRAA